MRLIPRYPFFTLNISWIPWKWLLALAVTVILVYGNIWSYEKLTAPPPEEAVMQALAKTINAQSYRYESVASRTLSGNETVISRVQGEKNMQGVHLKGSIPLIKAEVEIYQQDNKMYRRDSATAGWVQVPVRGQASLEQLIAEINPLGAFHFSELLAVKYCGKEKVGKNTCKVYEVMARGENRFMQLYWQDFNYRLWVDNEEEYIRKAQITAEHRDNSQHLLSVSVNLDNFNQQIDITLPDAAKG